MSQTAVVAAIVAATLIGDYALKIASGQERGLSLHLIAGLLLYAMPAFGWLYLMKTQSLAQIAVIYSSATILGLFFLGAVVFREHVGLRDIIAVLLAMSSLLMYQE